VIWRSAKEKWTRRVLLAVNAFLWDAWCDGTGACYGAGTDNTFLRLGELD
jgi:hypothetical protein